MSMPEPQAAHQALASLAGNWVGEETMAPSPWDPQGSTAQARVDNRLGLDGLVIVQDYEQRRGEAVTFRGHAVLWWDGQADEYVMTWWDSMGQAPNEYRGTWRDGALVMLHRSDRGSSRTTMRVTGDDYRFTMEMAPDGTQWSTWVEGTYRRRP